MITRTQVLTLALALAVVPAAHATYKFTFISATEWGTSDAALGLSPAARVENFENTVLITGLTVQVTGSSSGSYGPTGTLPSTFSTSGCGGAFLGGNWDGRRVLVNTGNNQTIDCGSINPWGDVTFGVVRGATQVGFSMQQVSVQGLTFTINDSTAIGLDSIPGYVYPGEARFGYLRIDVTGNSAPISTLKIDGGASDGWVVDHFAVLSVPEPQSAALMAVGLVAAVAFVRRHRAG